MDFLKNVTLKTGAKEQFALKELLAFGTYGKVHKAIHKASKKTVAIKIITRMEKPLMENKLLLREMYIQSTFKHDNICSLTDIYKLDSSVALIMEYIEGVDAKQLLFLTGSIPPKSVAAICKQVLAALTFLADNNIMHRDIKANNIMINGHEVAKVVDFGFATKVGWQPERNVGTCVFQAPEMLTDRFYGTSVDVWALGLTCITLAGKFPYPGVEVNKETIQEILLAPIKPTIPQDLPDVMKDFISCCIERDVWYRPSALSLTPHPFVSGSYPSIWELGALARKAKSLRKSNQ